MLDGQVFSSDMQLRRFNNSSFVQKHEIFHNICEKKMSKLKDINIPYVKSTSTMGWDELNVLKNGALLYLFSIRISRLYIHTFKFYDNSD